jgi:hypothetical protein
MMGKPIDKADIEAKIAALRAKIEAHKSQSVAAAAAPVTAATLDPFTVFLEDLLDILLTILETII